MANQNERRVRTAVIATLLCFGGAGIAPSAHAQGPNAAPLKGGAFGDTATFDVRILSLDPQTETATFSAKKYKNVIVLAVIPGREIEVIAPGSGSVRAGKGKNTRVVSMRRVDDDRPADADDNAQARLAYDRCIAQANAAQRRAEEAARRAAKRDSTGRAIGGATTVTTDYTRQCDRIDKPNQRSRKVKYLPPREPADRYLLVLSSSESVSETLLQERLATLTAVAPDVATTLEAIAAGLFVGTPGTWSGYYVAW